MNPFTPLPIDTSLPEDQALLLEFARNHVMHLHYHLKRLSDGKATDVTATAFPVAIGQHWHLVTAGHFFTGVKTVLEAGFSIEHGFLATLRGSALNFMPDLSATLSYDVEREFDMASQPIPVEVVKQLQLRGITSLDGERVSPISGKADQHFLFGFPEMWTRKWRIEHYKMFQPRFVPLRADRLEDEITPGGNTRLHFSTAASPEWDEGLASILGMSGGPIVTAVALANNSVGFQFLGIQSTWKKSTKEIIATPIAPFVAHLESLFLSDSCDFRLIDPTGSSRE